MILRSITVENWKQFFGKKVIKFSKDQQRNVTVIYGLNGSGKTAILNATLWCFYNQTTESFSDPLDHLNHEAKSSGATKASVEVEFEFENKIYLATREVTKSKVSELSILEKSGSTVIPFKGNPEKLISSVLPKSLAWYFFFDGESFERIVEQKDDETRKAVKTIIGVSHFDNALKALKKAKKKFEKLGEEAAHDQFQLKTQIQSVELSEQKIARLETQLRNLQDSEILKIERRKEIEQDLENSKDVSFYTAQERDFETRIKNCDNALLSIEKELFDFIGERGAIITSFAIATRPQALINEAYDSGKVPRDISIGLFRTITKEGVCICGRPCEVESEALKNIQERLNENGDLHEGKRLQYVTQSVHTVLEEYDNATSSLDEILSRKATLERERKELSDKLDEIKEKIEKIGRKNHAHLIDEKAKIENDIKAIVKECGVLEKKEIPEAKSEYETLKRDLNIYKSQNEKNNQHLKYATYTEHIISYLESILAEYERTKRETVQKKLNELFDKVASKNLSAVLNEDFSLELRKKVDGQLQITEGSKGEKQLLALLFIGSLVETVSERVGKDEAQFLIKGAVAPIMLDSPFGQLEKEYRKSALKFVSEKASQLVLLVSDQQADAELFDQVRTKISKEYIFIINENKQYAETKKFRIGSNSYNAVISVPSARSPYTTIEEIHNE